MIRSTEWRKKKEESMIQHDQVAYMIFQLFNLIVIH